MTLQQGTSTVLRWCSISRCGTGVQLEEPASLEACRVSHCDENGVEMVWPEGSDLTPFAALSASQRLECLLTASQETQVSG